jgi:hypothetical protein
MRRVIAAIFVMFGTAAWGQTTTPASSQTDDGLMQPTLITLHLKNADISEVLAAVSQQAKVRVDFRNGFVPSDLPPVTLDVERQPFWLVLKEICRQTKVGPTANADASDSEILAVQVGSNFAELPAVTSGCIHIAAVGASRSHSMTYGQQQNATTNFSLQLAVFVDPKLRVMSGSEEFHIAQIVDENGNTIAAEKRMTMRLSSGVLYRRNLQIPLRYDRKIGRKIACLSGTIELMAETKTQRWEMVDPLKIKDAVKSVPTGKITIRQFAKIAEGRYEMRVNGEREPNSVGSLWTINDNAAVRRSLQILDANGHSFAHSGGSGSYGNNTFDGRIAFSAAGGDNPIGEPAKLVWELPLECKLLSVPVEFRNLELP